MSQIKTRCGGWAPGIAKIIVFVILFSGSWSIVFAKQSASSLTPTRVVIPAKQKSASVTIRNTSDTELAYRMSLVEMGLDQNGVFRKLNDDELHPAQRSAKPIIRFSPRQVRLKPGASQVVRVIVRRGGLAAGEYRSHMKLTTLPVLSGNDVGVDENDNPVLIQSSSTNMVGMTIPVIVRHGTTDATVTLNNSEVVFSRSGAGGRVYLDLGLAGNRSAYGDFTVSVVNGKREKIIGKLKSFALFYPYPKERVAVALRKGVVPEDFPEGSKVRVQFENKSIDSGVRYWLDSEIESTIRK